MKISVLYIHHVGVFGGASRSLFELLKAVSCGVIQPCVISPKGQVVAIFEKENIQVTQASGIVKFDNTSFGYYRGLRWFILMRELVLILPTAIALRAVKKKIGTCDIIHVNELTAIPAAIMAKFFFNAPIVVHVRSVQRSMTDGLRGRLLMHLISRYVDQIVAIDWTVRKSLPKDLSVEIVHNGFPLPCGQRSKLDHNFNQGFSHERPLRVGCIGNLLKLKGVYELVEAAHLCAEAGLAVEFIFVGENPRNVGGIKGYLLKRFGFSEDVRADLESMIHQYALGDRVKINGFTPDVKAFYDSIDVLCFPSHLNACGRPVFEAAFSGVPSIVAIDNPLEDTIVDGQTGICIPAKDAVAIFDAVSYFYSNPKELKRMGEAAYKLGVKNFDVGANAIKMVNIYKRLVKETLQKSRPNLL